MPAIGRYCLAIFVASVTLLGPLPTVSVRAQVMPLPANWNEPLRALEPLSRTGVIYDRVLPIAHLERLDGSAATPAIGDRTWRQAYDELRRASLAAPAGPDLATLDAGARARYRSGVIPLALLDRAFERVRPGALDDGSLRYAGGRLEPVNAAALVASRAVAAAALVSRTYRGADVTFALDPERCFTDAGSPPRAVTIDFADGLGPRPVAPGEGVHVHYTARGARTLTARIERADGTRAQARFTFDVAALATPAPDDTLHVTATIPFQGQLGTGDAYVALAPGHTAIENPVVVIEGFDLDNSMNWDELYALLDQQDLIETLRADGFDAVVLNFTDATVAVEQNGLVVEALLERLQSMLPPDRTLALVGASMGGLCSRYALAYMESHAIPHRVRTWVSFDAPHGGADIPLGLQYWISFFSGQSADAAAFLATLQRPAAREMLLYHLTSPAGTTGQPDPMRAQLLDAFTAVGGYPGLPRRLAIANGSGTGVTQGFNPGAQVIRWEYSSLLVSLTGDVWAVPNAVNTQIFRGSLRVLFSTTTQNVSVSGTAPWDGAPGGSRASFTELDTIAAPYGDIVALHPSHCFVPGISALALPTGDPFFDIAGSANLASLTPFDAVRFAPDTNEAHVTITPAIAAWLRGELEQGVLAVPPGTGTDPGRSLSLSAGPSPFRAEARIAYGLPGAARVDLRVYDVRGREVRVVESRHRDVGAYSVTWDGRDAHGAAAGPGVYFLRLQADGRGVTRRVVRLE